MRFHACLLLIGLLLGCEAANTHNRLISDGYPHLYNSGYLEARFPNDPYVRPVSEKTRKSLEWQKGYAHGLRDREASRTYQYGDKPLEDQ